MIEKCMSNIASLVRELDASTLDIYEAYDDARKQFKELYGSCLDAPNYVRHWQAREDFAIDYVRKLYGKSQTE